MSTLHFLVSGGTGGIENLMRDYARYSQLTNYFVFFWGTGVNADTIKAEGGNVIELNYKENGFVSSLKYLEKLVENNKVESIVVHHAAPVLWILMALLKNRYKYLKTFVYAHGNIRDMYRYDLKGALVRKQILKYISKKSTCVIAISNSVKNSFIDEGVSAEHIKVIYNGVDCSRFNGLPFERDSNEIHIIYVGRLIKQKGVDRLLKALALVKSDKSVYCDIVGEGSEKEFLIKLADELKISDMVYFHGVRSDIPILLSKEDIFVHPARWEEGFGIAIVEAMAAGVIPIAYMKGAIPEIIDNDINGIIVQEDTPEALARNIEKLASLIEKGLIGDMRLRAREKAQAFDMSIFIDSLDELIRNER